MWPRELDGLWVVYGLVSQRAGWMFYVGTTSCLSRRLAEHYSCKPENATSLTIREMRDEGLRFNHCVFGVFGDKREALDLESHLIRGIPDIVNKAGRSSKAIRLETIKGRE